MNLPTSGFLAENSCLLFDRPMTRGAAIGTATEITARMPLLRGHVFVESVGFPATTPRLRCDICAERRNPFDLRALFSLGNRS